MNKLFFSDTTISENTSLSFKEKIEIARHLERMKMDVIEVAPIDNEKTDTLLVRTISALVENAVISLGVGFDEDGVEKAHTAISKARNARYRVEIPVSPIQMEFIFHKKPKAALEAIDTIVRKCRSYSDDVEFVALDATRAEADFLSEAISCAIEAGASSVCLCDSAASCLPEDFGTFVSSVKASVPAIGDVKLGVCVSGDLGMAESAVICAVKSGAEYVRAASCGKKYASVETLSKIIAAKGDSIGVFTSLNTAQLNRIAKQIARIVKGVGDANKTSKDFNADAEFIMTKNDTIAEVRKAVELLGYDLSGEDMSKVYDEFVHAAEKKNITSRELDAIVASVAMQCPPTYTLKTFVTNSGNVIKSSATVELEKDGKTVQGVSAGDGPIDAAFMAIEQIIGHHYELDDFQIQSVTEGREAMGQAVVKLRSGAKLYSGNGLSTDIISASVRAYLNAINKIVYEENEG